MLAAPPENKDSNAFSVTIDDWNSIQDVFLSPVYRINGYPWLLEVVRESRDPPLVGLYSLSLICDKSSEATLWKCTADIALSFERGYHKHFERTLTSWDEDSHKISLVKCHTLSKGCQFKFEISTQEDGNSWRLCPVVNFSTYDCTLVCGEKKEQIHVDKKSLASQSPFFDRLFYGDFMEKNLKEISIGDVEGEELFNIINLFYRFKGGSLSDENVDRVLQLADRFELKIVEDRAVTYLLSRSSSLSIVDIINIADQYNLFFLKDNFLANYTKSQVIDLCNSIEFEQLSHDLLQVLFNKGNIDAFSVFPASYNSLVFGCSNVSCVPNESNTISMVVQNREQFSPVHRINGFLWRIRVVEMNDAYVGTCNYKVYVICDKSKESELWKCTATISLIFNGHDCASVSATFTSWDENSHERMIYMAQRARPQLIFLWAGGLTNARSSESVMKVTIATNDDGESYCRRPSFDPLEPRDGIIVFEDSEKKIEVNKKSLASLSPYFDRLFFGNFKEVNINEFFVDDVKYEEFDNIMALLYESDEAHFHWKNAQRTLDLAERFELKIIEDRAVNVLLSSSSNALSFSKKLLIADKHSLPFLSDGLLSQFNSIAQLKELSESPEWNQMSKETIRILFKKFCV